MPLSPHCLIHSFITAGGSEEVRAEGNEAGSPLSWLELAPFRHPPAIACSAMEESASEALPELKDLEHKVGRKTPDALLRWLREDSAPAPGDKADSAGPGSSIEPVSAPDRRQSQGLAEKIRVLRLEMVRRGRGSCTVAGPVVILPTPTPLSLGPSALQAPGLP